MLAGQAKSMAYYKDLRKKVISIFWYFLIFYLVNILSKLESL
jgi:hypothetical protein